MPDLGAPKGSDHEPATGKDTATAQDDAPATDSTARDNPTNTKPIGGEIAAVHVLVHRKQTTCSDQSHKLDCKEEHMTHV